MIDLKFLKETLPLKIAVFDELDSTSLYCKRMLEQNGSCPDLVLANAQSNGQGRLGKQFFSPASTGLYLTFCFPSEIINCEDLTPRVALACKNAVEKVFSLSCGLKWVNDLYLSGRKVGGILCQNVKKHILIGIGINVEAPKEIPEDLSARFGSLCETCDPRRYSELVISLYQSLLNWQTVPKAVALSAFRNACVHIGKSVSILADLVAYTGICVGISDDFSIQIEKDGFVKTFSSGFLTIVA